MAAFAGLAGLVVLSVSLAAGCGGPAYEYDSIVTGTVTVDGELARSGTVTFHPVEQGKPAIGRIHPDGSYSLRTGQGDLRQTDGGTVVPGEYIVTVAITAPPAEGAVVGEGGPPVPGPSLIDEKYAQKETSDLRFTVEPGKQVIVLNLDRAEAGPAPDDSPDAEGPDVDRGTEDAAGSPDESTDEPAAPDTDAVEDSAEMPNEVGAAEPEAAPEDQAENPETQVQ